ncbi:hypothetical protein BYT27DRAFT_7131049 [Phlegmacium glaucopus]|nr:hypothetical protein BYT27DRAFT_7131049 [Phlegmacium glaucopus]
MHLFRIRSKSTQKQSSRSTDSNSASTSSSRPPLLPQTNLTFSSDDTGSTSSSSSFSNNLDVSPPKHSIGRQIYHRELDEPKSEVQSTRSLAPPPTSPSRAPKMFHSNHSDMYNDLNTFSFGAAPSCSSSSSSLLPVDPLSQPCDDPDPNELGIIPDTTPRPSVVGTQQPRSHQSQQSLQVEFNKLPARPSRTTSNKASGKKPQERDSDTASTHTFGNFYSSASLSSGSRPSDTDSRTASRTSGRSNSTHQTSEDDLSSDEELDGRHPLPAELSSPDLAFGYRHPNQDPSVYSSEEEFDVYNDDYDHDPETGIEIDSVAHPGSDRGTIDYHTASRESVPFEYAERRGSQALPITSSSDRSSSDRSYLENRARQNSLATLRRPSRSLDELYSFNFATASSSSVSRTEHPSPPAPTSVPQSEGDWRDLRKRSIQRDKDPPSISSHNSNNIGATSASNQGASELDGFDSSWMQQYGVNGVVGFDLSEMQDIVVEDGTAVRSSNNFPFRKGSATSAFRRQSTVSSNNVDIMYRHATGQWASQKYRDQRRMWTFMKEQDRLPDEGVYVRQNSHNHIERERPSISSFFASRPSSSATLEPGVVIPFFDGSRDREKTTGKEKASKEIWRGMPLDSEEFWNNQATGRFRVHRKNAPCPEPGKPPQHRLNITFIRTPYVVNPVTREVIDGPAVTIHRHSQAGAFSISRHFRSKSLPNSSNASVSLRGTVSSSRGQPSFKDSPDGPKKKSNMILLGTRKVQKAYTSTNTTRKLESHGLLDESGRASPRDVERMKREHEREMRAKAKENKDKDKDKKERGKSKEKKKGVSAIKKITSKGETSSKISTPEQGLRDSSGSSAGSVSNALSSSGSVGTSSAMTTPDPSEGTSSRGSIGPSVFSYETTSSDRTILRATPFHHRKRHPYDIGDDSSDETPKYPTRTPHRETYAVLPPEVFESARHQEHPTHGLFGWGKSRGSNQIGHRPNPYEASYNPPWPVTTPRINSETRKGIVDDLNMSFQDVGLLPAIGEIKNSHSGQIKRRREREQQQQQQQIMHSSRRQEAEIFDDVPSDALCMLLPLWPGETDPTSVRKYPFAPPPLSPDSRQYVLVYYKVQPQPAVPHEEGKPKPGEKKRSRNSPTSSHDSTNKREERGVLLNNFYVGARIVSHRELQGTGIRIPDVGLAVSGPLEEAYSNMPPAIPCGDYIHYILGVCNSRDAGIDFLQEGFEKMGLSRSMPNPNPVAADDDDDCQSLDTVAVLTPLGRAVMEMAWLGGLALTSFNPGG